LAIAGKIKLSKSEVSQSFNLDEIYGREPTSQEAQNFIELAKERIIERSQSGVDLNNEKFKRYSEDYADFKGVSRSDVDMTLFGDMLLSVNGDATRNGVRISISGDEASKAFGHMTGFRGHPTIKNGPKREFFGLTNDEAELIAEAVQEQTTSFFDQIDIASIVRNIGLVVDDN
jgi:phage gpG-like protein